MGDLSRRELEQQQRANRLDVRAHPERREEQKSSEAFHEEVVIPQHLRLNRRPLQLANRFHVAPERGEEQKSSEAYFQVRAPLPILRRGEPSHVDDVIPGENNFEYQGEEAPPPMLELENAVNSR